MGGMKTSTTTVDNLVPWSGPLINSPDWMTATSGDIPVAPKVFAHDYLEAAYAESLAPWGGTDYAPNGAFMNPGDAIRQAVENKNNGVFVAGYVDRSERHHQFKVYTEDPFGAHPGITYALRDNVELASMFGGFVNVYDGEGNLLRDEFGNIFTAWVAGMGTLGKEGDALIAEAKALCESFMTDNAGVDSTGTIRYSYLNGTDEDFRSLITKLSALVGDPDLATGLFAANKMPSIGRTLYANGAPGATNNGLRFYRDIVYFKLIPRLTVILKAKNFEMRRSIQQAMVNHSIDFGKQAVLDAEVQRKAGLYDREWRQGDLENRYKHWYDDYTASIRRLEISGNAIRSLVGTHETRTSRYYKPSPAIGIISGLATAAVGVATGNPMAMVSGVMGAIGSATN